MDAETLAGLLRAMLQAAQGAQEAAQAAVAASRTAHAGPPAIREEIRCIDKPERFAPRDAEDELARWDDWRHTFLNYVCAQDPAFATELDTIDANRTDEYDMEAMTPDASRRCRMMYYLLSSFVRGRPLRLVRVHERTRNGYLAWRDLLQELEPRERGRGLALLVGLVSEENWPRDHGDFFEQVRAWDRMCRRYEDTAGRPVADDLKVAVVLRHAPGELGQRLRLQASAAMTYNELILKLREYSVATRPWASRSTLGLPGSSTTGASSSTSAPMEVDALAQSLVAAVKGLKGGKKGKGKNKGRGKDGQQTPVKGKDGKGKGDKGRGAGSKGKKGKVQCYTCGGNHYARDCPQGFQVRQVGEGEAASSAGTGSSLGPSASRVEPAGVRSLTREPLTIPRETADDLWIMMIGEKGEDHVVAQTSVNGFWILVDSGADDHVCPLSFAPFSKATRAESALPLYDVQGQPLGHHGVKTVDLELGGADFGSATQPARITFVVGPVRAPLLSFGKLLRAGGKLESTPAGGMHLCKGTRRIPLVL